MSKEIEEWRDIRGYEGLYQVSNEGNIVRLWKNSKKIIKQELFKKYLRVRLWKGGIGKHYFVHRLVAMTFIPNPDNLPQVNHKDECKTNNVVVLNEDGSINYEKTNLEWCSSQYNNNYGSRSEKSSQTQRNDPNKSKAIMVFTYPAHELVGVFPSIKEVERQYGCRNISKVLKNQYKQEKGYTFELV